MKLRCIVVCCLALLAAPAGAADPASAEVSGAPVVVQLPLNVPLTPRLHASVYTDGAPANRASVDAYLKAGDTSFGRFATVDVDVSDTPTDVVFRVPPALITRARAAANRAGRTRASIVFVARSDSGWRSPGHEVYVSLRSPVRTSKATRIDVGALALGRQRVSGHITVPTPPRWPRTSTTGTTPATFGLIRLGDTCTTNVIVSPTFVAARSITDALRATEIPTVVTSGRRGDVAWSISTSLFAHVLGLRGTGVREIAPRRFAAVRVSAVMAPTCRASGPTPQAFVTQIQRIVSGLTADVRVRR
jgi:hypothetical protein